MSPHARRVLSFLGILAVLIAAWEGYKGMGTATGGVWPGTGVALPVRTNERSMPHTRDIALALPRPARRGPLPCRGPGEAAEGLSNQEHQRIGE